jgi:hypothetical protein
LESEWLEVVAVNDKYIIHGQLTAETTIEQVLTQEQKFEVDDLLTKHSREYRALLKGFVND